MGDGSTYECVVCNRESGFMGHESCRKHWASAWFCAQCRANPGEFCIDMNGLGGWQCPEPHPSRGQLARARPDLRGLAPCRRYKCRWYVAGDFCEEHAP